MKDRHKSRSGCRTCKQKRLRCDETKPECRNCTQKGLPCPGYQQRLQWSTKHERPAPTQAKGPANFTQLVTAASESIVPGSAKAAGNNVRTNALAVRTVPASQLTLPLVSPPASTSSLSWTSSSSSSSTLSPSPQPEDAVSTPDHDGALVALSREPATAVPSATAPPGEAGEAATSTMTQPVVDLPTILIEHWFKSVCSSWSALDSKSNPYRRLTAALWDKSEPVLHAVQSISAASLVERFPFAVKDNAREAHRNAARSIQQELVAFSRGSRPKFPTELLLALFCMSSSMCWMEARQLGQQYVRQARAVLKCLESWPLDPEGRELLEFFNGCLVYEEMLRSVVSDDEIDFENMLSWPEPDSYGPATHTAPHSWTGVSIDILRLFGKAIALCRRSRTRWRLNDGTSYTILQEAIEDIQEATKVEAAVLATVVTQLTDPNKAPETVTQARDLYYANEAYRLCALLQLYQTFPDLSARWVPTSTKDADKSAAWHSWVSPLALHITEILGNLSASRMGCIQPLLCLCAGSGLRYDSEVPLGSGKNSYLLSPESATQASSAPGPTSTDTPTPSLGISEHAIKISQARRFLMDRLDELELNLPPKPIGIAKQLLRAVWRAYDGEIGLSRRTHWLDVMSYTGLHSLFG
ncbi:hypothetical protein VTK26DRAFT_8175 [Humicola hyalothermophila]